MILSVWRSKQEISFEMDWIMMGELLYCVLVWVVRGVGGVKRLEGDWAQLSPAWCLQYVSCPAGGSIAMGEWQQS